MIPKRRFACENGSILWWVLIILVVLIVAAFFASKYLPGFSSPSSPVETRMKIPPMPPSKPPAPEPAMEESATTDDESPAALPRVEQEEADAPDAETISEPTPAPEDGDVETETDVEPETTTAPEQTESADEPETMAADSPKVVTETVATEEEPTAEMTSEEKPTRYTVQVGVFRNKAYAERKRAAMEKLGYDTFLSPVIGTNDETFYLVCTGEFQTQVEALSAAEALSEKENMTAVVARY